MRIRYGLPSQTKPRPTSPTRAPTYACYGLAGDNRGKSGRRSCGHRETQCHASALAHRWTIPIRRGRADGHARAHVRSRSDYASQGLPGLECLSFETCSESGENKRWYG